MFNGGYSANRYSPLKQINTRNVKSLRRVGNCQLPETTSFQAGPVMVGRTLYVTTATATYAIDARSAKLRWTRKFVPKSLGLGTPVRGVAYAGGRLFRGTPDARVIALDAKTGKTIWNVAGASMAKGEYFTMAPLVWNGLVYIGTSGSDIGTIGHMRAFRAKDGKQVWNFDIVPSKGPGAATWPSDPEKLRAGGGMYSSLAIDTATGTLYVPTGNPGPDFVGDYRPGANLYTCSVIMLDARSGKLKGYHQFVPHDVHDWDIAATPILYTSKAGRKMVLDSFITAYGARATLFELWHSNPAIFELLVLLFDRSEFLAELEKSPDIVLSDLSLPRFSGLRAAQLMRESGLNIPFILISGTVGEDAAVEAMKHGAVDYLLKDRIARLGRAVERAYFSSS